MSVVELERPIIGTALAAPTLTLRTAAVQANIAAVRRRTRARVMAVVKADGFGGGAIPVARAAVQAGAAWLGTTSVPAALALRRAGLRVPILTWLHPAGIDGEAAVHAEIDVAIASCDELREALRGSVSGLRVHLHLDVGMARGGAVVDEWPCLLRCVQAAVREGRVRVVGVMGHLPNAGAGLPARNRPALERFRTGVAAVHAAGLRPGLVHLAATAATLTDPATHGNLVRIGAGLVGIDPSDRVRLDGALELTAPIVHSSVVPAGTAVGYGGGYVTERPTYLSVLGVGYADGVPREISPDASVLIGGRRHRIVGAVSMDQIVVETGDVAYARGTIATVIGDGDAPTLQDWARWAGTIPHAIATGFGPRLRRTQQ